MFGPSLSSKMNLYKVERIVDRRVNRGVLQYKVKWQGYSNEDCTWQPLKNLKTVEDMVKEFERELEGDNEELFQDEEKEQPMNEEEEQQEQNIDDAEEYYGLDLQEEPQDKGEVDNDNEDVEDGEGSFNIQFDDLSAEESKTKDEQVPEPKKVYKHQNTHHFSKEKEKKSHKEVQFEQQDFLPQKSYLQQVQQRTRFVTKAPPKKPTSQIARFPQPGELKILQINRCDKTNQLIYLTQFGPVVCFRRHADMRRQFSDELIKFYESKIEFTMIPKIER